MLPCVFPAPCGSTLHLPNVLHFSLEILKVLAMHIKTPPKYSSFNNNKTEYFLEALAVTPLDSPSYIAVNSFAAIRLNPKIISYILQGDMFQIQMNLILCISFGYIHKVSGAVWSCCTVSQHWPTNAQWRSAISGRTGFSNTLLKKPENLPFHTS